jgi:hypothetical protein
VLYRNSIEGKTRVLRVHLCQCEMEVPRRFRSQRVEKKEQAWEEPEEEPM